MGIGESWQDKHSYLKTEPKKKNGGKEAGNGKILLNVSGRQLQHKQWIVSRKFTRRCRKFRQRSGKQDCSILGKACQAPRYGTVASPKTKQKTQIIRIWSFDDTGSLKTAMPSLAAVIPTQLIPSNGVILKTVTVLPFGSVLKSCAKDRE